MWNQLFVFLLARVALAQETAGPLQVECALATIIDCKTDPCMCGRNNCTSGTRMICEYDGDGPAVNVSGVLSLSNRQVGNNASYCIEGGIVEPGQKAAVCTGDQTCNTAGNNTVSHNATSSLCVTTTEVLANRAADTNGDKICIGNGTAAVCSATQTCNTAGTNGSSHDAASGVCVAPEEEEDGEFGGIEIFLILLLCFAVFAVAAVLVYFYWGSSDENMDKSGENKDGEKKDDDKKKPDENTDKKKAEEKTDKKAEEKTDKKKADKKTDKKTAEEDVDLERAEGKVEDTGV